MNKYDPFHYMKSEKDDNLTNAAIDMEVRQALRSGRIPSHLKASKRGMERLIQHLQEDYNSQFPAPSMEEQMKANQDRIMRAIQDEDVKKEPEAIFRKLPDMFGKKG